MHSPPFKGMNKSKLLHPSWQDADDYFQNATVYSNIARLLDRFLPIGYTLAICIYARLRVYMHSKVYIAMKKCLSGRVLSCTSLYVNISEANVRVVFFINNIT